MAISIAIVSAKKILEGPPKVLALRTDLYPSKHPSVSINSLFNRYNITLGKLDAFS